MTRRERIQSAIQRGDWWKHGGEVLMELADLWAIKDAAERFCGRPSERPNSKSGPTSPKYLRDALDAYSDGQEGNHDD